MRMLIGWRKVLREQGDAWQPEPVIAGRVRTISYVQTALVLATVTAAVAMARGYGMR